MSTFLFFHLTLFILSIIFTFVSIVFLAVRASSLLLLHMHLEILGCTLQQRNVYPGHVTEVLQMLFRLFESSELKCSYLGDLLDSGMLVLGKVT